MAVREFGRLDIMICNAGSATTADRRDAADVMQRMMDVNYMGTFYGARAALPIFRAQNSGHLIFVSSIVGRRGIPLMGGYTATKAAQAGSPNRCAPSSPARRST
jgi:NADP-dependent 3-hydroxy acid dehydrogenase YdfG